jgi:uncharacterized LabA/DUF88 family protein
MSMRECGWKLDWSKLRTYLREKYGVTSAYLFIGFMREHQDLYKNLQKSGFILIFKETQRRFDGSSKGNVDAELVLNAMIEYSNYDKAVIITGDGDFACLVTYLRQQKKLAVVLAPNQAKYSAFLKKSAASQLGFISNLKSKLEYIPKMKSTR